MRLAIAADLTKRLRAAENAAVEAAEQAALYADDNAVEYPQCWRDEEAAMLAELAACYEEALWAQHREVPSLLARVREVTCGKMIRPTKDTRGDWRRYCPSSYRRMADGVAADEAAEMLGYETDDELLSAIRQEAEEGALYTHAQCAEEARQQAASDPEYLALIGQHYTDYEEACAAAERCEQQAEVYRTVAQAQSKLAAALRTTLAVLLAAPAAGQARGEVAAARTLPSRASRKAVDPLDLPTFDERALEAGGAALTWAQRTWRDVAEGAGIVGGWMAQPARAAVAEARQAVAGWVAEARTLAGGTGRHGTRGGILAMAGGR